MKKELIKKLEHFALIVRFYTNVISTENAVNFWRHILPYLYFLMKDIITKKTVQIRRCHLHTYPRKQNSLKVYNILRWMSKCTKNVISTQNVVNFWRYILPYLSFLITDIVTKKDSSSSTMSFTNLTMKTELVKGFQHFALNVKLYKNVISTQNVVNFWRQSLPYLSFLMKDIITKTKTVQVRWYHLKAKQRKQNSLKVYNIFAF